MSQQLLAQIRKGRQIRVPINHNGRDITLIYRRPTDLEVDELSMTSRVLLHNFVEGWEDVQEKDLVPGETDEPVPFSLMLYCEWIDDNPPHWDAISEAIMACYKKHNADLKAKEEK